MKNCNLNSASEIKKQEGDYFENLFQYSITLNKLNQTFNLQMGFYKFIQSIPLYSDDNSFENTFLASKYHSISDNLLITGKIF